MSDAELARFALIRRYVRLSPDEEFQYARLSAIYEDHVARAGHRERAATPTDAWRMFVASARRSPPAAGTYEFLASQKRGAGVRRVSSTQLGFGL